MTERRAPMATCPACGTEFTHTGDILSYPTEAVDPDTWDEEDALPEGGFGWFPGSDEGTGMERERRRRD